MVLVFTGFWMQEFQREDEELMSPRMLLRR